MCVCMCVRVSRRVRACMIGSPLIALPGYPRPVVFTYRCSAEKCDGSCQHFVVSVCVSRLTDFVRFPVFHAAAPVGPAGHSDVDLARVVPWHGRDGSAVLRLPVGGSPQNKP